MQQEFLNNICNPNYDFRLREDIYQRFRFPFEAIKAGSRVVIYGGGVVGKIFLQQISKSSYCTVRAICDRNPRATGIMEAPVISVAELSGMSDTEYDVILIALEQRSIAVEVREDLIMAGISSQKIIYINPSRTFCSKDITGFGISIPQIIDLCAGQTIVENESNAKTIMSEKKLNLGFEADSRYIFPFDEVQENSRVIIYGGDIVGKTFLVQALSRNYIRLLAVCDRNPEGTGIKSVPVIDFNQLPHIREDNYDIILVAIEDKNIADEIIEDLLDLGISKEKIHWYNPVR